jgi:hypothetical protein
MKLSQALSKRHFGRDINGGPRAQLQKKPPISLHYPPSGCYNSLDPVADQPTGIVVPTLQNEMLALLREEVWNVRFWVP